MSHDINNITCPYRDNPYAYCTCDEHWLWEHTAALNRHSDALGAQNALEQYGNAKLRAECDDLKRRLAELEAGAAAMRAAIELVGGGAAFTTSMKSTAGRDFLAAARKCLDVLTQAKLDIESCIEFPENHDTKPIEAAIAVIEPYVTP